MTGDAKFAPSSLECFRMLDRGPGKRVHAIWSQRWFGEYDGNTELNFC